MLIELFGLVEVDLDGGQCRLAAGAVGDLDVDLGTVERNLSIGGLARPELLRTSVSRAAARCHLSGAVTYFPPALGRESR